MDPETQELAPADGAPVEVESPATPDEAADKQPTDDASAIEQPRDPKGRFVNPEVQARIDKKTWEAHEAQRQSDYWRERAERAEQAANKPVEPIAPQKKPTLESVGYDEAKYDDAMVEYLSAQALARVDKHLNEREQQQQAVKRQETFQTRQAEFAATVDDYDAVVYNPRNAISPSMADNIAESDIGPQLAYYLGKNPEVARQIAALPARAASRELGKIEAKLTAPKAAPAVTKAPPPPPKIPLSSDTGIDAKPTESDSDKLSNDAWMRARDKQIQRKAQGK